MNDVYVYSSRWPRLVNCACSAAAGVARLLLACLASPAPSWWRPGRHLALASGSVITHSPKYLPYEISDQSRILHFREIYKKNKDGDVKGNIPGRIRERARPAPSLPEPTW